MEDKTTLFWFRRDLRLDDNAALYHALKSHNMVQCMFIFDTDILTDIDNSKDARVTFIFNELKNIHKQLAQYGASLKIYYGKPKQIFTNLFKDNNIVALYANHDYEPYARKRDSRIAEISKAYNVIFKTFKDQVIFEKNEILNQSGLPYKVFTPYAKNWKRTLDKKNLTPFPSANYFHQFKNDTTPFTCRIDDIGFVEKTAYIPSRMIDKSILKNYHNTRDYPYIENGTSRLSIHLRFGTISIRNLVKTALNESETYLNELIWREFYMMILWHFPHVAHKAFKPKYDYIKWRNNENEFSAWCEGKTGFPIVDAGMRQLNNTGYMHNRVRMITASFLTKNLLIDWRWGETYFAQKLLDYDLSANNGGWQWAAGSGCDAAPYFRIFNPDSQLKKFDPNLEYVKKWINEYEKTDRYIKPMVDIKQSRLRALETYKNALQ